MKLLPLHPPWSARISPTGTIRLRSSRPLDRLWYLIRLRTVGGNQAAAPLLKKENRATGSYLLPGRRQGEWELVFFHAEPLSALQLELSDVFAQAEEIRVSIIPVSAPGAILSMSQAVSGRDRSKGIDPTRIYRKSWARWRRHGRKGFLLRLVREYQPQEILSVLVRDPYEKWLETVETPAFKKIATLHDQVVRLPDQPLISIIMTAGDTPELTLRKSIESVLAQSYPCWELCIAVAAATSPGKIAGEYADRDPRIRFGAQVFSSAEGGYVAQLDPGDELARHALLDVAMTIAENPDALLLYSDEDRIDLEGKRFSPHFKPCWNPDLFFSYNYLSRLCVVHRTVLTAAGGFSAVSERDRDYDLLLRCLAHLGSEQIVHIPRILCHRRASRKSTPTASSAQSLRRHLQTLGRSDITVEAGPIPGMHRLRYPIPTPEPRVSLLIPTRDRLELIETCVRSILAKTTYRNYEILILDNQSEDADTLAFFDTIRKDERVRVLRYDHPFNYSAINNFGVRNAAGEIIGLVNNDIEVIASDWLTEMVSHACREEIGCVGAKLYYPDDTIQHAGVIVGLWGVAGHGHKHFPRSSGGYENRLLAVQNCSAVTAACLLVRRRIYEEVGGLDEENLPVAFNDVDFCLKVRAAGYRNLWTPYAELYHHESVSRGSDNTPEKKARELREIAHMKSTWASELAQDPCYSPNLTRHLEDFSINLDHILFPPAAKGGE